MLEDRVHAIKALIRVKVGNTRNIGNIHSRFAKRKGIDNPLSISLEQLVASLKYCQEERKKARKHASVWRKDHLSARKEVAVAKGDFEAASRCEEILKLEVKLEQWKKIKRVSKGDKGRSVTRVERIVNGKTVVCEDQ